jgi:hypothetical protein
MIYNSFLENNLIEEADNATNAGFNILHSGLEDLFKECGGVSIEGGLYRVHSTDSCMFWSRTHLKRFSRRTICFSRSIVLPESWLKLYFLR